ncbi:MAG: aminotransferase class III-fold pyridoxal phosphate-dependent enzyme, partial [Verrucomicrobiota bacterium]
ANAGLIFPREGFLETLRELTSAHDSVLIFDEVMTGFRLAKGGVQERTGIIPDLTAMGKVIGGGLPVGAFGGRAEIMDQIAPDGPVYQAGTLSGNPLAMAAGLAQLKEMDHQSGYARLEETGQYFEDGVREALKAAGKPYVFNRIGSMFCLFFTEGPVTDLTSAQQADTEAFKKFFTHCLENGIYLAPSPYETGFISIAHAKEDLAETIEVMAEGLKKI